MITPEEATLIIKGWFESKSELLLSASMISFSVYAKCRVVDVTDDKVTLWSSKDDSVFTFSVGSPSLSLRYTELREASGKLDFVESLPPEAQLKSALVVSLPLRELAPLTPEPKALVEQITLVELW